MLDFLVDMHVVLYMYDSYPLLFYSNSTSIFLTLTTKHSPLLCTSTYL